jgi:hypothetical protein
LSEPKGKMTHPDPEVLAEFRAGLVTGRHGARISAHLAGCEHCAGRCDQLAEISVLLTAVPAPAMPDAVARRLEGVLAAEAAQRHSSERAVDDSARDRASSPPPRRPWGSRPLPLRVLAPAAAVVLLAAGGYGLSRIAGNSASSVTSGTAAAPAASSAHAGSAAAPPGGATSRPAMFPAERVPTFGVVTSQTYYLRGTLRQQLERELARHPRPVASVQRLAPVPVKECVLLVTKGVSPGTLRLVERAHFQGQPANVIVAWSGRLEVAWVTTPTCSASSDYVLDRTTLPGTSAS